MITKIYLVAQVIFSVLVILFGTANTLRCLIDGQLIVAIIFAAMAYVCGYLLLLNASLKELREYDKRGAK